MKISLAVLCAVLYLRFCLFKQTRKCDEVIVFNGVFIVQTHIVCHVPPYHPADAEPLKQPQEVQIIIHSNGRSSEPVPFTYHPRMS